jgi:hypothetical protein
MPSKMKPCEDYRTALTDAAAAAVEPSLELRSHLEACPSCRAAFTEEMQLFAAIDSGVVAVANAEVPASFFPRVRAGLEGGSVAQRRRARSLIFAAAGAAIVLIVFIAARTRHTISDSQAKQIVLAPAHEAPQRAVRREATTETPAMVSAKGSHRTPERKDRASRNSAVPSQLEVLVPPDEREAFARFISVQQKRSDVVIAVVVPASGQEDALLSVEPLLIAKLKVTPLEQLESGAPDSTQEQ